MGDEGVDQGVRGGWRSEGFKDGQTKWSRGFRDDWRKGYEDFRSREA